jgi:hypothetical protein
MELKPYGATITCNQCREKYNVYNDVSRCGWCGHINSVILNKIQGRWIYPPTLLNIDRVTRLPYYPGD